jgi:hypothetical protein
MNEYKFRWIKRQPTLEESAKQELELLDKSILERELNLIDLKAKLNAEIAKREFIVKWFKERP